MDHSEIEHGSTDGPLLSRLVLELLGALVAFGFGATVVMGALEHPVSWSDQGPQAGTLPLWLGVIAMLASLGIGIQAVLQRHALSSQTVLGMRAGVRIARFLLPIFALVALTMPLGLYLATALYLIGMLLLQGHGWKAALFTAVAAVLFNWFAFEYWFMLPLPKGPVEAWLGLA